MKTLKIAVMGCAAVAQNSMLPAIRMVPEWDLVAIASRTEQKAQQFARQFDCEAVTGYEALLHRQDIDAIYMPLPTGLHHEWIMKCLDAGKHVLAEKSIAYDYASAKQMVELARSKHMVLMENFMFQYHSQHRFVFEMLRNKEIGDIRVFRASFGFPPLPKDNFRYDDKIGGGALLDAAGYTVRAVHLILGDDFVVRAANLFYDRECGTTIYGGAFLSNGKGVSAQLGFGFDHFYQCNYKIWGSKGKITVDRAYTPKPDYSPFIIVEKQGERQEYRMDPDNHFVGSIREFHRAITEGDGEKHYRQVLLQSRTLENIRSLSRDKYTHEVTMSESTHISVISPVYGAAGLLEELVRRIKAAVSLITEDYEIILVEDCGPDNSWELIRKVCAEDKRVIGIRHSRNFGQQYALNCGLDYARGEWVVTLDCDLQDRPEEIVRLYGKAKEGYEIVLASRQDRQDDFLKKFFSRVFYRVLTYLTDTHQDPSIANFALYHRKVVDALKKMGDYSRYYPTMNRWVGFRLTKLEIRHAEREDGIRSSYSFKKRLILAFDTIISFSNKPLLLVVKLGIIITLTAAFAVGVLVFNYFLGFLGRPYVSGWASTFLSVWFLSGIIITVMGMIGVYVGKIFETVRERPTYIVGEKINCERDSV